MATVKPLVLSGGAMQEIASGDRVPDAQLLQGKTVGSASGNILDKAAGDSLYATVGHNHDSAYQPLDAQLTALAGLSFTSGSLVPVFTAATTVGFVAIGSASGNILDKAAGDSLYATVGHNHTGTYQPLDATLTALAGASWSSGTQVFALTAADTVALKTVGYSDGNILDKASGDALYAKKRTDAWSGSDLTTENFWFADVTAIIGTQIITGTATGAAEGTGASGTYSFKCGGAGAASDNYDVAIDLHRANGTENLWHRSFDVSTGAPLAWRKIWDDNNLVIGTHVQAYDAQLTALAGLSWSAGSQVPVFTGATTVGFVTVGSASGNILDKAAGDSLYAATARGLPSGGTANQVLSKIDGTNYNVQWVDAGAPAEPSSELTHATIDYDADKLYVYDDSANAWKFAYVKHLKPKRVEIDVEYDLGAVPGGATNNNTTIQNWMDSVWSDMVAQSGKYKYGATLLVPEKPYGITGLKVPPGLHILGAGKRSQFRLITNAHTATSSTGQHVLKLGDVTLYGNAGNAFANVIRNLTLNGNSGNQSGATTGSGLHFDTSDSTTDFTTLSSASSGPFQDYDIETVDPHVEVQDVWIYNAVEHGVYLDGRGENHFRNVMVENTKKKGWYISMQDSRFFQCVAGGCGEEGFVLTGVSDGQFFGCKAYYTGTNASYTGDAAIGNANGDGWVIYNSDTQELLIQGCVAQDTKRHGIYIFNSQHVSINGFTCSKIGNMREINGSTSIEDVTRYGVAVHGSRNISGKSIHVEDSTWWGVGADGGVYIDTFVGYSGCENVDLDVTVGRVRGASYVVNDHRAHANVQLRINGRLEYPNHDPYVPGAPYVEGGVQKVSDGYPSGYTEAAVDFDGTNDYLTKASGFGSTVAPNINSGSFVIRFKTDIADGTAFGLIHSGTDTGKFRIYRGTNNKIEVRGADSGGTARLSLTSDQEVKASDGWVEVMCSWNASLATAVMYINGKPDALTTTTLSTGGGVNWATTETWNVGNSSASWSKFDGLMSFVWMSPAWLDFRDPESRLSFRLPSGRPQKPTSTGVVAIGAPKAASTSAKSLSVTSSSKTFAWTSGRNWEDDGFQVGRWFKAEALSGLDKKPFVFTSISGVNATVYQVPGSSPSSDTDAVIYNYDAATPHRPNPFYDASNRDDLQSSTAGTLTISSSNEAHKWAHMGFGLGQTCRVANLHASVDLQTGLIITDVTNYTLTLLNAPGATVSVADGDAKVWAVAVPFIQLSGAASVWNAGTNAGSGGAFTMNGSVTDSTESPSYKNAYQPLDPTLTALAGATWTAGTQIPAFTAGDTVTMKTVGQAAGNILDKAAGDALYAPIGSGGGFAEYTTTSVPSTPSSGITPWARTRNSRQTPLWMDEAGRSYEFMNNIATNNIAGELAQGGNTTVSNFGMSLANTGTLTTRNPASTNFFTACRRVGLVTATANNSTAGRRYGNNIWCRGTSGQAFGGFMFTARFGLGAYIANMRAGCGLSADVSALGASDPSALTNSIIMGKDAADTTWQIMHNDGTSTCTKVNLGASFPANTSATDMYELRLYAPVGADNVYYSVLRMNTGDLAEGTISTNYPSSTQFMGPQIWCGNGSSAGSQSVAIDMMSIFVESLWC